MMTGKVDDYGRPLLAIGVVNPKSGAQVVCEAWVDTGFTGSLMLLPDHLAALGATPVSTATIQLADGSHAEVPTHKCVVNWFGAQREISVLAGTGKFALVGLLLLDDCRLVIDYPARTVELTLVASSS